MKYKKSDIVVISKPVALWQKVVANLKAGLENSENELKVNKEFLEVAEKNLAKAKAEDK